MNTMEQIF